MTSKSKKKQKKAPLNNIKKFRLKAGLSQNLFAQKVKMKTSTVGNYENRNRAVTVGKAWQLVQGLRERGQEVSFEDVFPNTAECEDMAA